MSATKRQYVADAFTEAGLSGYIFDLQPEQLETALRRLDTMMATWNAKGIRLGWPMPGSPQGSDLDQVTNVPDAAYEAIILGLAIRIAPAFGKTVALETKANAKMAYDQLLAIASMPPERQLPGSMPSGAGNKPWRNNDSPFVRPPCDPTLAGPDGILNFD